MRPSPLVPAPEVRFVEVPVAVTRVTPGPEDDAEHVAALLESDPALAARVAALRREIDLERRPPRLRGKRPALTLVEPWKEPNSR